MKFSRIKQSDNNQIKEIPHEKGQKNWKRDAWLVFFFLLLCMVLAYIPTGYEEMHPQKESLNARARVVTADNSDVRQFGIIKQGSQRLSIEILDGPFSGRQLETTNTLVGDAQIDNFYKEGDTALAVLSLKDGDIHWAHLAGPYRLGTIIWLCVLFSVLLLLVAGITGLKALLSFVFAAMMIWKVLIPCFLNEINPILVALIVVACLTAAVSFLVGGMNRKGLVAFLGSFLGILLTCGLAILFSSGFHLTGAVRPFAKALLQRTSISLDITSIFIAGIFIACSGAVMDLAMDISAAMYEVRKKKPTIGTWELIKSGLGVGRVVVGTMTTTLLLAYSGSYMTLLMFFMAQGIPLSTMLNTNFLSAEILNTLVGSFGLVTVAPFTALAGGLIYARGRKSG